MQQGGVERRRGRRANVQAPVRIKRVAADGTSVVHEETAQNVSLAGVYFETEEPKAYTVNEVVTTSISIPTASTREFPFTRLAGRSRVVRVHEAPTGGAADAKKRCGVALEFGEDFTALTALPSRG